MSYTHWGCATFALLVLTCIGITLLKTLEFDTNKEEYEASYAQVRMYIQNMQENSYRCCAKRNCRCQQSHETSCNTLIRNLESGSCAGGYKCCYTVCDTCSQRYCASRNSNYGTCTRYATRYYNCNCRCGQSVGNQQCQSYCSSCYRPIVTVQYIHPDQILAYRDCILDHGNSDYEYQGRCWRDYHTTIHERESCGIDDRSCVKNHFGGIRNNTMMNGFANKENPNDIQIGRELDPYKMRAGTIAGFVLLSIFGFGLLIATIIIGFMARSAGECSRKQD